MKSFEKILTGKAEHSVTQQSLVSAIEQVLSALRVVFAKALEGAEIFGAYLSRVLHFDRIEP